MNIKKTFFKFFLICVIFSLNYPANAYEFNPHDPHHYLYVPKGKGPFPAVIVLHASLGIEKVHHTLAKLLLQKGYAVYIIDSFTPRHYKDRKSIGWDKATAAQLADVPFAFHYLETLANIDSKRIGIIGFSMAGYDVLRVMQTDLPIKAAASFYGVCKLVPAQPYLKGPLQIFIGQDDDRATFADCVKLVNNNRKHDKQIFISTYPHAFHGFDNPEFPPKLERIDEKGEKYHIGYNAEARTAALKDLMVFFDKNLK